MPVNDANGLEHDHCGAASWHTARDAARAAGGDLSPLVDMHPIDREWRLWHLSRSDVPDERALALHQAIEALIEAEPNAVLDGFYAGAKPFRPVPPPPWQDVAWAALKVRPFHVHHARRGGHVMVVRESASMPGTYYPVVDGHHLFWRGGPERYTNLRAAMAAAEAAARWHRPPL